MKNNFLNHILLCVYFFAAYSVKAQNPTGSTFTIPSLAPQVKNDGTILFRLRAPAASKVILKLENSLLPMSKDKRGTWSVNSSKMEPDIYTYTFIADSITMTDPANPLMRSSYFGGGQSLVIVPGTPPKDWEVQDVPHGTITRHLYKSNIIGESREYYVYTPPGYDPLSSQTYPVLYLLHGMGDDARGWTQSGYSNIILDNLIYQKRALPMIIVYTLGYGEPGGAMAKESFERFTQSLTDEIIPFVEKDYRADKKSSQRAIAGLSMGGAQALLAGLNHPELFQWVGGFSSAFIMYGIAAGGFGKVSSLDSVYSKTFPELDMSINDKIHLLWISCGTSDFLYGNNNDFMKWLDKKQVKYHKVETSGAHTWMVWRRNLIEFAPLLFR
ncbi:MAG: alpha/beta hydrolase-fold protein [Bacteroidota bacterium]